jgi:hypothetical protein
LLAAALLAFEPESVPRGSVSSKFGERADDCRAIANPMGWVSTSRGGPHAIPCVVRASIPVHSRPIMRKMRLADAGGHRALRREGLSLPRSFCECIVGPL